MLIGTSSDSVIVTIAERLVLTGHASWCQHIMYDCVLYSLPTQTVN